MRRAHAPILTLFALAVLVAAPASADVTLFFGTTTTPANRVATGFAIGGARRFIGGEFELSNTSGDTKAQAPSLNTGVANILLQTPVEVGGVQPYLAGCIGIYRETLEAVNHQKTSATFCGGGGLKVALIGTVRLRLDYRVFRLGRGALNSPAHRVYAGLNLKL